LNLVVGYFQTCLGFQNSTAYILLGEVESVNP